MQSMLKMSKKWKRPLLIFSKKSVLQSRENLPLINSLKRYFQLKHVNLIGIFHNYYFLQVKKTTKFSKAKTLILFARCDREKEDWYRRFSAASAGKVYVTANSNIINPVSPWGEINAGNEFPDLVMVNSAEVNKAKVTPTKKAIRKKASKKDRQKKKEKKEGSKSSDEDWKWAFSSDSDSSDSSSEKLEMNTIDAKPKNFAMGLIMSACASQGPEDHIKPYLQFMSVYQVLDHKIYVLSVKSIVTSYSVVSFVRCNVLYLKGSFSLLDMFSILISRSFVLHC